MAFRPLNYDEGKLVEMPCATTITIAKGNALVDNGSGYLTNAANTTAVDVHYVAMEGATTTANGDLVLCIETENVLFDDDCDAAWATANQGTYADLASVSTVNPDATTNDLFYILKGVGTTAVDTTVLGYFTRGIPNS